MSKATSERSSPVTDPPLQRLRLALADLIDHLAGRIRPERRAVGRPIAVDDPLWAIVGSATSEGTGDASTNQHRYLAEAYEAEAAEGVPQPKPPERTG